MRLNSHQHITMVNTATTMGRHRMRRSDISSIFRYTQRPGRSVHGKLALSLSASIALI